MAKLSINLLGWNHRKQLPQTIEAVLGQSFRDFELIYSDNASTDGSAGFVAEHYPGVRVIGNKKNLGYAGGHNRFFVSAVSEFVMVLNPDVHLTPNFLEEALKPFADPRVAAVCGKLLRPQTHIIDSTGIIINRSRRGRDRGQWEEDRGQYDQQMTVFGVNGAAPIFRRSVLEKIKVPKIPLLPEEGCPESVEGRGGGSSTLGQKSNFSAEYEYFDEDFFAYWEDLDLSWRLNLAGYKCAYAPRAVAYHERAAGQSRGGYLKLADFVKHHRGLSPNIKKWNWRNHLFCIIKNDFGWPFWRDLPFILGRELAMLVFIAIFETRTLSVMPDFFRLLPKMRAKRRLILAHKSVTVIEAGKWFV